MSEPLGSNAAALRIARVERHNVALTRALVEALNAWDRLSTTAHDRARIDELGGMIGEWSAAKSEEKPCSHGDTEPLSETSYGEPIYWCKDCGAWSVEKANWISPKESDKR